MKLIRTTVNLAFSAVEFIGFIAVLVWKTITGSYNIARAVSRLRYARQDFIQCPKGHNNPVFGKYECGNCGGRYDGWVWECPLCGSPTSYINCCTCGLSIKNPWL